MSNDWLGPWTFEEVKACAEINMMDPADVAAIYMHTVLDLSGPAVALVMKQFFDIDLTRGAWRSRMVRLLNLENVYIQP